MSHLQHVGFQSFVLTALHFVLRYLQGVLTMTRSNNMLSGTVEVGSIKATFPPVPVESGPVYLGIQALYGYNFSITISQLCISYGERIPPNDQSAVIDPPPEPSGTVGGDPHLKASGAAV